MVVTANLKHPRVVLVGVLALAGYKQQLPGDLDFLASVKGLREHWLADASQKRPLVSTGLLLLLALLIMVIYTR